MFKQTIKLLYVFALAILAGCGGSGGGGGGGKTSPSTSPTVTVHLPTISKNPDNQAVASGNTATFSVTARGDGTVSYQWQVSATGRNWSNVADGEGATDTSYTTAAAASSMNNSLYRVIVTNTDTKSGQSASVSSNNVLLSVIADTSVTPPTITKQPVSQNAALGNTVSLSVEANGAGSLSYQWQVSPDNAAWENVLAGSGGASASYTTPAITNSATGWRYRVLVSNSGGTTLSNAASLTSYGLVSKAGGGAYDKTECFQDNVTGLMWEGKTADGLRAAANNYTNYDSSAPGNGQKYNEDTISAQDATAADVAASTNTMGYIAAVNAQGLCGYSDWRLPTKDELLMLLDMGALLNNFQFNPTWLPDTNGLYWTSTPDATADNDSNCARFVGICVYHVRYDLPGTQYIGAHVSYRINQRHVRLVRPISSSATAH